MNKLSLSARILIGLLLGILTGLFFGEKVAFLGMAGRAFLLLLQMTVLPYVVVALIKGIGSMDFKTAGLLAKKAGSILLLMWLLTLVVIMLFPVAFPNWESASYFSTSMVESAGEFDFISMFIPANPFGALAENVVPGVVLFSVAFGIALIGVPKKQGLLDILDTAGEALGKVATFVVRLAPYGVFALLANAAGTIEFSNLQGLQVYVITYLAAAVIITFWVMPGLIAALTPIRHKAAVMAMRDALVTGFATGNLFVVLPLLSSRSRELVESIEGSSEETAEMVDIITPTSFTFPSAGKLLALAFILFAGWMTGFPVSLSNYPVFAITGFFTWFGSTLVSVPFMLDMFRIPADTFSLFIVVDNIFGRFGVMVAVIHVGTLAVLGSASVGGLVRLRPVKVIRYLIITAVITIGVFTGIRLAFTAIGSKTDQYESFIGRSFLYETVEHKVFDSGEVPSGQGITGRSALSRIRESGVIRVGYAKDALPWVFRNDKAELVGLDVEMMHRLASELNLKLEFYMVDRDNAPGMLNDGLLDVLIGGLGITTPDMTLVTFTAPYLEETLAFIVRDHRREEFNSAEAVLKHKGLRIGLEDNVYYREKLKEVLPDAEIVTLESPRKFFRMNENEPDALLLSAETGSSWCLIYPEYTVAVPHPNVRKQPLAYAVALGDRETAEFLGMWIGLKKNDMTISNLFDYWIAGKKVRSGGKRWSVIQDVLGWVD
jgi:Na+/H+-dicarboxylate symporter/ABC-type amino acid transport substrate-binding protein